MHRTNSHRVRLLGVLFCLSLSACIRVADAPSLPAPQVIFSDAVKQVDYELQRFELDNQGQVYGTQGNKLFLINSLTDELTQLYDFGSSIVGFHIASDGRFIISTDNNHWREDAPCYIYESTDKGRHFKQIKQIEGGCALWLSIDSDKDNLYLGEYGPKKPNISKRVWRQNHRSGQWSVIFQAKLDTESHIHRVAVDPYTGHLWVSVGDTKKNRGIYLSKDQGLSWNYRIDSQATAVVFLADRNYWGEDDPDFSGVFASTKQGTELTKVFSSRDFGNYAGSIYELLAMPDGSVFIPIMKYADSANVASLWFGSEQDWSLLIEFESLPGRGNDVSSIAGPDKNGFVFLTGFKIDMHQLEPVH